MGRLSSSAVMCSVSVGVFLVTCSAVSYVFLMCIILILHTLVFSIQCRKPCDEYSLWQVFRIASILYSKYSVWKVFCKAEWRVGDNAWVASGFTEVMAAGFRRD